MRNVNMKDLTPMIFNLKAMEERLKQDQNIKREAGHLKGVLINEY